MEISVNQNENGYIFIVKIIDMSKWMIAIKYYIMLNEFENDNIDCDGDIDYIK